MIPPDREAAELQALVGRWFRVYEVTVRGEVMALHVQVNAATLEKDFEALRLELGTRGFIPFITKERGEHLLYLQRKPPPKFWSTKVNLVLLIVTILTTGFAGALSWASYDGKSSIDADATLKGIVFFSIPLLLILGIHEMGHYVVARRYKVAASLPFFIPSIPPLGTFGAMISMREPIPTRRALMDIGAAGPLLGFAVAIPVTLAGLFLTSADPRAASVNTGGGLVLETPIFFQLLQLFVPLPSNTVVHPTLFAGWVGIFVTALNLLPAGQLDGGHIARALLGERAKYASYAAVALMILLSIRGQIGWSIIALLIIFLGLRHPPPLNDLVPLDRRRILVGVMAGIILVTSFVPFPFGEVPVDPGLEFREGSAGGVANTTLAVSGPQNSTVNRTFAVVNTGNLLLDVTLELENPFRPYNWTMNLTTVPETGNASVGVEVFPSGFRFRLNATEHVVFRVAIDIPPGTLANEYLFSITTEVVAIMSGSRTEIPATLFRPPTLTIQVTVT